MSTYNSIRTTKMNQSIFNIALIIMLLLLFIQLFCLRNNLEERSRRMIHELAKDIACWRYKELCCEENSLYGIKRIKQLNTSHPIKDGISLIYFIRKPNGAGTLKFGPNSIEWSYHCCVGFRDLYVGTHWIIDLSYHCMVDAHDDGIYNQTKSKRMIEKSQYLQNVPCTADTFVIPFENLEYFINQYDVYPSRSLEEFLDYTVSINCYPYFAWVLHPGVAPSNYYAITRSMLNRSIIYKLEDNRPY